MIIRPLFTAISRQEPAGVKDRYLGGVVEASIQACIGSIKAWSDGYSVFPQLDYSGVVLGWLACFDWR